MPGLRTDMNVVRSIFRVLLQITFTEIALIGCDNAIHAPTQRVGDADCRMVCSATHAEFCGNQNRVAVYQFSSNATAPGPAACLQTSVSNFTLRAQLKNPPTTGPSTVPLKIVVVEIVKNVLWTILSVSPPV